MRVCAALATIGRPRAPATDARHRPRACARPSQSRPSAAEPPGVAPALVQPSLAPSTLGGPQGPQGPSRTPPLNGPRQHRPAQGPRAPCRGIVASRAQRKSVSDLGSIRLECPVARGLAPPALNQQTTPFPPLGWRPPISQLGNSSRGSSFGLRFLKRPSSATRRRCLGASPVDPLGRGPLMCGRRRLAWTWLAPPSRPGYSWISTAGSAADRRASRDRARYGGVTPAAGISSALASRPNPRRLDRRPFAHATEPCGAPAVN